MVEVDALWLQNSDYFLVICRGIIKEILWLTSSVDLATDCKLTTRHDCVKIIIVLVIEDLLKRDPNGCIQTVGMVCRLVNQLRKLIKSHLLSPLTKHKQKWLDQIWLATSIWANNSGEILVKRPNHLCAKVTLEVFEFDLWNHQPLQAVFTNLLLLAQLLLSPGVDSVDDLKLLAWIVGWSGLRAELPLRFILIVVALRVKLDRIEHERLLVANILALVVLLNILTGLLHVLVVWLHICTICGLMLMRYLFKNL